MQIKCPHCGGACEIDCEPENGQHLRCPYCMEKFNYSPIFQVGQAASKSGLSGSSSYKPPCTERSGLQKRQKINVVFDSEVVSARLGNAQILVDGQDKSMTSADILYIPVAIGVFQFELVAFGTIRLTIAGKHREDHGKVIVWIVIGESDFEA